MHLHTKQGGGEEGGLIHPKGPKVSISIHAKGESVGIIRFCRGQIMYCAAWLGMKSDALWLLGHAIKGF